MKKGEIYGRWDELIKHLYSSFIDQKFLIRWLNDNFGLKKYKNMDGKGWENGKDTKNSNIKVHNQNSL